MANKILVILFTAGYVAAASFKHDTHYKTVNAHTAKNIASAKGRSTNPTADLVADQGFWFSNFTIGSSPNLEILIDTGSSDAVLNPGIYQPGPNSQDTGRQFRIGYSTTNPDGSGSEVARGEIYLDVISQHGTSLSVSNQTLGAISSPASPDTFPHQGLIGYAGTGSSALGGDPFFLSLCDQGSLDACRFGLALRTDQTGSLYYGDVASDQFSSSLATVSIQSAWTVPSASLTLNGKVIRSNIELITDSGTTVIFGPTAQVKSLFKAAGVKAVTSSNGAINGVYPCNAPPTIGFKIGGQNFNILPKALAFKQDGNNCTASVVGTSDFGNDWLVGQAFFQGRYIDHNFDDSSMGFADLIST